MEKNEQLILTSRRTIGEEEFRQRIFPEMKKTTKYFSANGVRHLNVRNFSNRPKSAIIPIGQPDEEELYNWIKANDLFGETINITMNPPKEEALKKKSFNSNDFRERKFLLIDVDTERPKNTSATEEMIKSSKIVMDNVAEKLTSLNCLNFVIGFSGNGYHLLLEGNFDELGSDFPKKLLKALANEFNNSTAHIDTVTSDIARLTKLYGCLATKGIPTVSTPHRQSYIVEIPEKQYNNNLDQLYEWVNLASTNDDKNSSVIQGESKRQEWIQADAKKWLDYYGLEYTKKAGDRDGIEIFSLLKCPLKEHSNNQHGFAMIQKKGHVSARCLHQSHEMVSINEFAAKYPLIEKIRIDQEVIEFPKLNSGVEYDFFPYKINQNQLKLKKDDNYVDMGSPAYIDSIYVNIEDNVVNYKLMYKSNGEWRNILIDGTYLQQGMLRKLSKYGIELNPYYEAHLINFLNTQKQSVIIEYNHERIGWDNRYDSLVFRLKKTYGKKGEFRNSALKNDVFELNPRGSYGDWLEMINNYVLKTNMELMLAIGFSSMIFSYLKILKYPDLTAPLINLSNKTSTGKSTAQMFVVSLFSDPNTAMDSMNATANGVIGTLKDNYGVPYALDELGTNSSIDLTQLIYAISSGRDRKRMTKDGSLRKRASFATIVTTSSENPIGTFTKNETGLRPRVIDFIGKTWTKDAEASENIKRISSENHGQAAIAFTKRLFEEGHETILEVFEEEKVKLLEELTESPVKSRVANNYALITTATKLIIRLLEIDLDYEFIKKELISLEKEAIQNFEIENQSIEDKILEWLLAKANHFVKLPVGKKMPIETWGVTRLTEEYVQVNIFKNRFEDTVKKLANVENPKRIIKDLVKSGVLYTESDRQNKRIDLNKEKKRVPTYELRLSLEYGLYFGFDIPDQYDIGSREKKYKKSSINGISKKISDNDFNL